MTKNITCRCGQKHFTQETLLISLLFCVVKNELRTGTINRNALHPACGHGYTVYQHFLLTCCFIDDLTRGALLCEG